MKILREYWPMALFGAICIWIGIVIGQANCGHKPRRIEQMHTIKRPATQVARATI